MRKLCFCKSGQTRKASPRAWMQLFDFLFIGSNNSAWYSLCHSVNKFTLYFALTRRSTIDRLFTCFKMHYLWQKEADTSSLLLWTVFQSILIMDAPSSINYFSGIRKSISQLRTIHELKCFISPAWYQTYLGTCVWVSVVRVRFIRKKNALRYRKTQSCQIMNLRTLDFIFW